MWYAITEYLWGASEERPQTRSVTKVEEGWVLVQTENKASISKVNL